MQINLLRGRIRAPSAENVLFLAWKWPILFKITDRRTRGPIILPGYTKIHDTRITKKYKKEGHEQNKGVSSVYSDARPPCRMWVGQLLEHALSPNKTTGSTCPSQPQVLYFYRSRHIIMRCWHMSHDLLSIFWCETWLVL